VLHCEQFVIYRYNVDLLLGGGQHFLASCQVGIHVNNKNRLSDGVVRDVDGHSNSTSHRQCQLCHVQSQQLHAPNTSLSISFNVRLFHSLTAAVTVPKWYRNCCASDKSRTAIAYMQSARFSCDVCLWPHIWCVHKSINQSIKTGWSQTYVKPDQRGNIKVDQIQWQ